MFSSYLILFILEVNYWYNSFPVKKYAQSKEYWIKGHKKMCLCLMHKKLYLSIWDKYTFLKAKYKLELVTVNICP